MRRGGHIRRRFCRPRCPTRPRRISGTNAPCPPPGRHKSRSANSPKGPAGRAAEIDAFIARAAPLGLNVHLYTYNPVPTSDHRPVSRDLYERVYARMCAGGLTVRMSSQARVEASGGCGTLVALSRAKARLPWDSLSRARKGEPALRLFFPRAGEGRGEAPSECGKFCARRGHGQGPDEWEARASLSASSAPSSR